MYALEKCRLDREALRTTKGAGTGLCMNYRVQDFNLMFAVYNLRLQI